MRVDGLTATAHRGMGKAAQCGMLTRGQWDGPWPRYAMKYGETFQQFTNIYYYVTIISQLFVLFPIISHIYYYLCYLLLFCSIK